MKTGKLLILLNDFVCIFCWTLLHSLWQGLLLAVAAYVFMLVSAKRSSASRYNVFCSLIVIFAAGVVVTFFAQMSAIPDAAQPFDNNLSMASPRSGSLYPGESLWLQLIRQLNYLAPYLFGAWLLVFLTKIGRLSFQFKQLKDLKKNARLLPLTEWQEKLKAISSVMHIVRPVLLAESAFVKIPVLIGHLKPIILLPIGFVNNLTPQQVETILIHELAHVRRNDYLVNIVQQALDTVFFFNPAFLWLSRLVRTERENCCDDFVLSRTGQKPLYISTLIRSYEQSINAPQLGIHFSQSSYSVLSRVRRMVEGRNSLPGLSTPVFLLLGLIISFVLFPRFATSEVLSPTQTNGKRYHYHASGKLCTDASCKTLLPKQEADSILRQRSLHELDSSQADPMIKDIIRNMLAERVITRFDTLSFTLTKQKLVINGVEQASCIAQMLQDDYLSQSGQSLIEYNYQNGH